MRRRPPRSTDGTAPRKQSSSPRNVNQAEIALVSLLCCAVAVLTLALLVSPGVFGLPGHDVDGFVHGCLECDRRGASPSAHAVR